MGEIRAKRHQLCEVQVKYWSIVFQVVGSTPRWCIYRRLGYFYFYSFAPFSGPFIYKFALAHGEAGRHARNVFVCKTRVVAATPDREKGSYLSMLMNARRKHRGVRYTRRTDELVD
jgi:hypothetical protein